MNFSATELGKRSGEIILEAQREPVTIMKNGKACVGVVSISDLELLAETKKTEQLRGVVQAGFSQIELGEYSTRSMSELGEEAMKRVMERRKTQNS